MTRNHASLQRQPLFTPIWLTAVAGALFVVLLGCVAWVWATADATTVIVVRHAEKAADGDDPALTAAGEARAAALARLFADRAPLGRIDAIYTSPFKRNRMTAAPLAAALGITPTVVPPDDPEALVKRALHDHGGKRILIVGHSDTVPGIVGALSGSEVPAIADDEYGTLYIVAVPRIGHANVLRLAY